MMFRKIMYLSLIALISAVVTSQTIKAQSDYDAREYVEDEKVNFNELIDETLTHINERSSFIADDRGPASIILREPQPRMFPDLLSEPPMVVERFVVPQLDVPFSEFNSAPLGAGFTYNWQAPWSGF